jgi:hypothetical protein
MKLIMFLAALPVGLMLAALMLFRELIVKVYNINKQENL